MIEDELLLTEEDRKLGISKVIRTGTIKNGFTIVFTIDDFKLRLPTHTKSDIIFARLRQRLMGFKSDLSEKAMDKLRLGLESTIIKNLDWFTGNDVRREREGFASDSEVAYEYENEEDESKDDDKSTYKPISISKATKTDSGKIVIEGIIATATTKTSGFIKEACWKCHACGYHTTKNVYDILDIPPNPSECGNCDAKVGFAHKHKYRYARLLQIRSGDNTTNNILEMLPVYVFDDYTENIKVSEKVKIYGRIVNRQDPQTKQFHPVLVAKFVEYTDNKQLVITKKDLIKIHRLSKSKTLEENLINQFAPNVYGEDFAKLTIILSAIGAPEIIDPETGQVIHRGRAHILLIGPPGCAKTRLAGQAIYLLENSKLIVGTRTTAPSITSMVLLENGEYVLKLGSATTAVGAFFVIDEFDKLSDENKNAILRVMEEGDSILNTYAFLVKLNAQTTVITTANPENNNWLETSSIGIKELPFELQILSRFDFVVVFRRYTTMEECDAYGQAVYKIHKKLIEFDYELLQKYIETAKQIINIEMDSDAEILLRHYNNKLFFAKDIGYDISNRTLETLYRIAYTFARLRLSNIVTKAIAQRTIKHFDEMLNKLNLSTAGQLNPSIYSFDKTIEYFQEKTHDKSDAKNLVDVIKNLCLKDETMSAYIGDIFIRNKNDKLDRLCEKILALSKQGKLKIVGIRPAVVYWIHKNE